MPVYDVNGNKIAGNSEAEEAAKALGLHLMPKSIGEVNMVRRARQFTDIEWTPAVNIKRRNVVEYDQPLNWSQGWQDTFLAGVKYKGIPYSHGYYSGADRNYGMVGYQVTIDAFATSVQFADSYFCATDHYNTSSTVYTNYGASCDTLVCYAMGLSTWYGSDTGFQTLLNNGVISTLFSSDDIADHISDLRLGDILWKKAVHVAVITDVVIAENGDAFIEVAEATTRGGTSPSVNGLLKGGVCRRELWSVPLFLTRFSGYTVYRYTSAASVTYTQSPFVTLEGEDEMHNLHDRLPLLPYMGEGFEYLSGHIPNTKILIGSADYDYLAVYKDGSLFNTFTINQATEVATNFSANGSYEAFLYNSTDGTISNMTNRTVSTTWKVKS